MTYEAAATNRILTIALCALLSACDSADGGPDAGEVIGRAADYWAADAGNLWLYDGREGPDPLGYRNRVTVDAAPAPDGMVTFTHFPSNGVAYRRHDSRGIHSLLYRHFLPSVIDYVELPEQIRLGTYRPYHSTRTIRGTTFTHDLDVTVLGFEDLVLPAGTFAGALRTRRVLTSTITFANPSGPPTSSSSVETVDLWYAKGVGVIKTVGVEKIVESGATFNDWSEQLAGVRTAQITAGIVGELVLLDELAPADSSVQTGSPGIASDGEGYLVAARRIDAARSQTEIVATYVDAVGRPVWSQTVISDLGWSVSSDYYDHVAVAFDGDYFWIVARSTLLDPPRLLRQRVTPVGQLLDPPGGVVIAEGIDPRLASDGGSMLLVHARNTGSPAYRWDLYSTLYDLDIGVVRPEQQLGPPGAMLPAVAARVAGYAVTFETADPAPDGSARDVYALRVNSGGHVLDVAPIAVSAAPNNQGSSAVAPWADGFVALWVDSRDHGSSTPLADVFGARLGVDGVLLDGPAASGGVALQRAEAQRGGVAAATGPLGTLLAWTGMVDSPSGVFARRFAPGAPFEVHDPADNGVALASLGPDAYATRLAPAAAASARSHMVTWIHNTELAGTRKSIRGTLVFPRYGEVTP